MAIVLSTCRFRKHLMHQRAEYKTGEDWIGWPRLFTGVPVDLYWHNLNNANTKAPLTRCNLLSNRLSNRFANRVNACIHDTTGCQTRCQPGCQTRLTTGLTAGWMFVYTIQPVVQPAWQPVVSCKRGLSVHTSHLQLPYWLICCWTTNAASKRKPRLHDTTCCQSGYQTGLTTGCIV